MKLGARSSFLLGVTAGACAIFSAGVLAFASSGARGPSAAAARGEPPSPAPLSVFERAQTPGDAVPRSVVDTLVGLEGGADIAEDLRPGRLVLQRSRLLLGDLGTGDAKLYAFPSTKGRICYALTVGPQGCVARFSVEQPVSWSVFDRDGYGAGTPTAVFGLAPNNVVAVEVVGGGATRATRLANNAYFLEMSDGVTLPEQLVVRFRSGRSTTVDLGDLRIAGS